MGKQNSDLTVFMIQSPMHASFAPAQLLTDNDYVYVCVYVCLLYAALSIV